MQTFKKSVTLMLFVTLSICSIAQKEDSIISLEKMNMVKLNLSSLVFKNVSIQYERKIAKRITVAANINYMPVSKLPFLSSIKKAIDDPSVPVDKAKLGSLGIKPELRLYIGKKGAFHGFYIAPFASYTRYKTDLPFNYGEDSKTAVFSGNVKTFAGGLLFGAQWKLGRSVYLDWWIIGPNYGKAKGDLAMAGNLSATEQDDLSNEIEDIKADAPFDNLIESYKVSGTGASIKANGPWAGLRGLGFTIGIRF